MRTYSPPNRIPIEEYNRRVRSLMESIIPKGRAEKSETKELFELYNDRNLPFEYGTQCSACRGRVFNRMKAYWETIKNG